MSTSLLRDRIEDWRKELLDLSNRNRLLNYRISTTRPSGIHLVDPALPAIYRSLANGDKFELVGTRPPDTPIEQSDNSLLPIAPDPLRPGQARADLPKDRLARVALRLAAAARSSEQEQGVNTLFAVFGLLRWQEDGEKSEWRHAPLVLLPVKLENHPGRETYVIRGTGDDPEINLTLIERLRHDFGISITAEIGDDDTYASLRNRLASQFSGREGWSVEDQVHVSTFQFHKLRMYQDLGDHLAVAESHPIVRALGTDNATIAVQGEVGPTTEDLDRLIPVSASRSFMDADASQREAIELVKRGSHLVIEGPPGTGKSQTIANLIAEAVASGKSVLFVSEKAAALEVVHARLSRHGLGDLCLMLHSHRASKQEVIAELGRRLDSLQSHPAVDGLSTDLDILQRDRDRLDAHTRALHQPRGATGWSVYMVYGELATVRDSVFLSMPVADPPTLTVASLRSVEDRVAGSVRPIAVLAEGDQHPWRGVNPDAATPSGRSQLQQSMHDATEAIAQARQLSHALAAEAGLSPPTTIAEARSLARLMVLLASNQALGPEWLDRSRADQQRRLQTEALVRSERIATSSSAIGACFEQGVFDLPLEEAVAAWQSSPLASLIKSGVRALKRQTRSTVKPACSPTDAEMVAALNTAIQLRDDRRWFEMNRLALADCFALDPVSAANLSPSDWRSMGSQLELAGRVMGLVSGPIPITFRERAGGVTVRRAAEQHGASLLAELDQLDTALGRVSSAFRVTPAVSGTPLMSASLVGIGSWLGARTARFGDLTEYVQAEAHLRDLEAAGLAPIVSELTRRGVSPDGWKAAVRRRALTDWVSWAVAQDPVLHSFNGDELRDTVDRFRELDKRSVRAARQQILSDVAKRSPALATGAGEPAVLRHEMAKRKRHMPLRRLFARIPNLLPVLKPCLMMSPLSVAQFLPANLYRFDLVVFDEASQVRPHDAIGAIMRGHQLVVAGDENQLPPTAFFDRSLDDPEMEDTQDLRALESVLLAVRSKNMRRRSLHWHYRSHHEHLIAWSNHHMYGGELVTFPRADDGLSPNLGVHLEYVADGVYEDIRDDVLGTPRRVNLAEAKRVIGIVRKHARSRSGESLGVVTLNMNQRDLIEEQLHDARMLDEALNQFCSDERDEPFFVKALEQVQGDERDRIVISIGFGKDRQGILRHNFGPINQDGGDRRLNVLVTRARYQIVLVASIRAGDIDLGKTTKRGPRLLREYLDFAERGPVALSAGTEVEHGGYDSPLEESVADALRRRGWDVRSQIGVSRYRIDLAVAHPDQPGRFLLGIECDGRTYHSLKTVRDRDRLRQQVLEDLGWQMLRVWSTEWFADPERELDRIEQRLRELLQSTPTPTPQVEDEPLPELHLVPTEPREAHATTVPYREASLGQRRGNLADASILAVAEAVVTCVQTEGPIHQELLTRRLAAAWGHARAGSKIAARVQAAVNSALRQGTIRRVGDFLWMAGDTVVVPRGPTELGNVREIAHIAPEELAKAAELALGRSLSLSEDELVAETARTLGYARVGPDINRILRAVIAAGLTSSTLTQIEGRLQLAR